MNYLASKYDVDLINNLTNIVKHKFKIISYQQAINLLKKAQNVTFQYSHLAFGVDLQKEHEKYLCHLFKKPVFIYNFPSGIKSFYMKHNADQQTVASVDLLIPMIGELMGGSERTSDINQLYKQMIAKHIDPAHYE